MPETILEFLQSGINKNQAIIVTVITGFNNFIATLPCSASLKKSLLSLLYKLCRFGFYISSNSVNKTLRLKLANFSIEKFQFYFCKASKSLKAVK